MTSILEDLGEGEGSMSAPGASDFDFSFGDLVAEAVQLKAEKVAEKESRKNHWGKRPLAGANTGLHALLNDIREDWKPVANVAMFQIQHCASCDNYTPLFTGLFQRQTSRSNRGVDRWLAVDPALNKNLEKEVKTTEIDIPFCHFCLAEHGYPADQLGIVFDEEEEAEIAEPTEEDLAIAAFEAAEDEAADSRQLVLDLVIETADEFNSLETLEGNPSDIEPEGAYDVFTPAPTRPAVASV